MGPRDPPDRKIGYAIRGAGIAGPSRRSYNIYVEYILHPVNDTYALYSYAFIAFTPHRCFTTSSLGETSQFKEVLLSYPALGKH